MSGKIERIRTTHAGSLPRPPQLRKLLAAAFAGEAVAASELEDASATATRAVVERQLDIGIDIVNNGEQGRECFFTYVQHRMSGFGGALCASGWRPVRRRSGSGMSSGRRPESLFHQRKI